MTTPPPSHSASRSSSYLDKTFAAPQWIWDAGFCDLDLVASTISRDHVARLRWLAQSSSVDLPAPGTPDAEDVFDDVGGSQFKAETSPGGAIGAGAPADTKAQPRPTPSATTPAQAAPISSAKAQSVVVPMLSQVWNAAQLLNYQAQFHVGTIPVTFLLDIDTGSSLLWVQAQLSDADPGITDQNMYRPSTSTTSKNLEQILPVAYGDGTHVRASIFDDDVLVEVLIARGQKLGAVSTSDLSTAMTKSKSNGLIGLGFPPSDDNLVQTLQRTGVIKYASFTMIGPRNDPKRAAEIDAKGEKQPRGHLVIGAVDSSFYTGTIAWCPQIPNVDSAVANRWVVKLDAVLVNDKKVFENQYALIDSGTAYILTSPKVFRQVQGAIAGARLTSKPTLFMYPPESLASISFVLGGRQIRLNPQDFSLGGIRSDKAGNKWACSSICTLPSPDDWQFHDDLWVLGGVFMDNVTTIFDFANKAVGFADITDT